MKWQIVAALLLLSLAATLACAQSIASKAPLQATEVSVYWTDPATNLIWAAKDNGEDVSWKGAANYCHKLNLAGHTDWRMPNMDEAQGIFDIHVKSPGTMGAKMYHNVSPATWHVKGNLFLTGDVWTTLRPLDDRGKLTSYAYYFDFNEGKSNEDPIGWPYPYVGRRALCVCGPQSHPLTKQ